MSLHSACGDATCDDCESVGFERGYRAGLEAAMRAAQTLGSQYVTLVDVLQKSLRDIEIEGTEPRP